MLVVVPSHKRLPLLRWSILSVLRAGAGIAGEKRLLVVGNHPPSNAETRVLMDRWCAEEPAAEGWEVRFIGRQVAMDPVDSWYGAITEHAREDEVVFLHGDDDVVMPGGLKARIEAMESSGAPILVSRHLGPLIFRGEEECYPPALPRPDLPVPPLELKLGHPFLGYSPFIGNLAYRFGPEFRSILEMCSEECDRQTWLPRKERTLMLPYYLPLVALREGKKVAGLDHPCVIRGNGYEEIVGNPFQGANWNNGFLYGITLDFLSTGACAACDELEGDRALYRQLTTQCFFSVCADRRIPADLKSVWIQKVKRQVKSQPGRLLRGLLPVLGEWSRLTRLRLRVSFGLRSTTPVKSGLLDRLFGTSVPGR